MPPKRPARIITEYQDLAFGPSARAGVRPPIRMKKMHTKNHAFLNVRQLVLSAVARAKEAGGR